MVWTASVTSADGRWRDNIADARSSEELDIVRRTFACRLRSPKFGLLAHSILNVEPAAAMTSSNQTSA
jgi:hypothetical protein